ncbi:MAG TPA: hypothetical protein VMM57_03255 [Bacteroidota bacterium]|nr:hypothetical protein [Bacteroidota bacterium]
MPFGVFSPTPSPDIRQVVSQLRWIALSLIVLAVLCDAQFPSDPDVDIHVQKGIDLLYNVEFDRAQAEFDAVIKLRPDEPVGYFMQAMVEWWNIVAYHDDGSQDQKFYDMLERVIDMCEKRLDRNPDDVTALFFKGGAVGFRGRLRAERGKWLGAANDGMVALPLVRKAHEIDPKNEDVLLGIGVYNYYADVIPDMYPFVKPVMIFFPGGDRKKGLEQLKEVSERAKYAKVEASYILLQDYFTYEKEYAKAYEIARSLCDRFPRNPVFRRYLGRCLVSVGRLPEANEVFLEIEKRFSAHDPGYDDYDGREASYYIGRFEFVGSRYQNALRYFYACDSLCRRLDKDGSSGFMAMANLHIGMIYDLQKRRAEAVQQYQKVLQLKEYENSRKDAARYIETPYARN